MDTPDKKAQPSPSSSSLLSKFEDSPVFNYLSTLSPIKPFKSGLSGQPYHLLTFASPQSSQISPAFNFPKESHGGRGTPVSDLPKNDCRENDNGGKFEGTSGAVKPADLHKEEVGKDDLGGDKTGSAVDESSKLGIELPKSLEYDCHSPENSEVHYDTGKPLCEIKRDVSEVTPLKVIRDSGEADCSFENEMGVQRIQLEQNREACDWEKFIYEASDILNCHSPKKERDPEELDDKSVDSGALSFVAAVLQPPNENVDNSQKTGSACPPVSSENHGTAFCVTEPRDGKPNDPNLGPAVQARSLLAEEVVHYSNTEMGDKSCSQQQQTTRRRCLVYEMSGSHYRKLLSDHPETSPTLKTPASPNTSNDKCSVVSKPGGNKFSSLLPGIGLHLNALAATARDKIIVKRQTLTCRRQLISSPCTTSTFNPVSSDAKPLNQIAPEVAGNDSNEGMNGDQVIGNACQASAFDESVEFSQNSPKKKRRKPENGGEADSCKRCNCKRSKCLKLYCECFAAGLYCVEPCNCQDCFNKPIHEETVLETRRQIESRNPLAFAPKVVVCSSSSHNGDELKTPASARHKRGCNCKKSGCLKKYCECFQGGVGCSLSCRCEGCKNTFGRKEGSEAIAIYGDPQLLEKGATDHEVKTDEENQEQATAMPSKAARQPVRRPFHFGSMIPQFLALPGGPPLQPCENQKIDQSVESAFEEDIKISLEDEGPEVLKDDYSLPTVKSSSPNCKRVSPPHGNFETSPGWKSCRKLILRSIPAFPSMSPEKKSTELQGKLE